VYLNNKHDNENDDTAVNYSAYSNALWIWKKLLIGFQEK